MYPRAETVRENGTVLGKLTNQPTNLGNTLGIQRIIIQVNLFKEELKNFQSPDCTNFYSNAINLIEQVQLIDQLLTHSSDQSGKYKYLIKWVNPNSNDTSWEEPIQL